MSGKLDFEFSTASGSQSQRQKEDPFVMLVLGNFGGQADAHADDPSWLMQVPIRNVDLDNIEELWAHFKPCLKIEVDGVNIVFTPTELEDFHPDQLYRHLPVFEQLRQTRKRLLDPVTAQDTLNKLVQNQPTSEDGNQMFERLLGNKSSASPVPTSKPPGSGPMPSDLDRLLHHAVAAQIVPDEDPRVDSAINAVDTAISTIMRGILHQPEFQRLESSWRSLYDLIYDSEIGEQLLLKVCNVDKQALLAGLPESIETMHESGLYQLLAGRQKRAIDDAGYSLLVCDYYFGHHADDIVLLAALANLAELNDAAILGAAKSELTGTASIAQQPDFTHWRKVDNPMWAQLRNSSAANRIGLAIPRVLGRLPYGDRGEQVDSFDFEEQSPAEYDVANHGSFLWSNPSFRLAGLLAKSFTENGWKMQPEDHCDIGGLPAFIYSADDEQRMLPTAETLLSERTAQAIMQLGLMPIVSLRNRDMARLIRFQSIASPPEALKGPW